jgi:hypothetical protein
MVSSLPFVGFSQLFPDRNELLNGGGWWNPLPIVPAFFIDRFVHTFHAMWT